MRISVHIARQQKSHTAVLCVELSDGRNAALQHWVADGRAFTIAELDDIWSAVVGELDIQQVLELGS